jgi:hypothetical protein
MKQELSKFWKRLNNHPGVTFVIALQMLGVIAGLMSKQGDTGLRALLGFSIMSVFWIPVIWTAWTDRNRKI